VDWTQVAQGIDQYREPLGPQDAGNFLIGFSRNTPLHNDSIIAWRYSSTRS
jgi:hypothetical protein